MGLISEFINNEIPSLCGDNEFVSLCVSVKFENNSKGVMLGDPKKGCFHLAITNDGGNTWQKIDCDSIPKAMEKEAPFAASNSNIEYKGSSIWFATGGSTGSRIYNSKNNGSSLVII